LQKAYENLPYKKGDFPVTERVAAEIISLPMFPQLSPEQQDVVVARMKDFVGAKMTTSQR
jgi:dTDP-4-amino-4,6-dideoxygalactose transaminase